MRKRKEVRRLRQKSRLIFVGLQEPQTQKLLGSLQLFWCSFLKDVSCWGSMPTKKVNAVVREGTAESRGPDSMLALCSSSQPSLGSVAETMLIYHRGEPNASHRLQASYSSQSSCNLLWINGPRSAREQNGVEGYPLKHKKLKHRGYRLETYLCILWSPSSLNTPADSGK